MFVRVLESYENSTELFKPPKIKRPVRLSLWRTGLFVQGDLNEAYLPGLTAVARLAQRPARPLLRAKFPTRIHRAARPFEVNDDTETMLSALESVSLRSRQFDLVDSGPERITARSAGHFVAFTDLDLGVAFAIAIQANSHFPAAEPLSLYDRVRGHIEILNVEALAPTACGAAPPFRCARVRHDAHDQEPE
jgi:hypothetical protein